MKKIMYLAGAALLSLAACTDDYKDWAQQEQPTQPVIETTGLTVEAPAALDVATVEGTTVKLFEPTLANTYDEVSYTVSLSNVEGTATVDIPVDAEGNVLVEDLQGAICDLYGRRPVERTVPYTLTALAKKAGNVYKMTSSGTITLTPQAPHISENYYIVGGPNEWTDAPLKQLKFNHSGKDVYEDPVFTIVFDAAAGDTWFAIGDDEACEAIPADWSKLLGIVGGDNQASEGRLDVRSNMGADNSFCVPAGAKKIKVTINMLEYTFKVEPVSIADAYYLVGGPGSWSSDKSLKFSHSNQDVFDDPIFYYTFEGNGGTGDIWFAFGDAEALDAIDNGDWNQLFGYSGELSTSGSFDRRSVLGGEYTFHVDGTAKFYRFTVNMAEKTYEIKELNFAQYIWQAGNGNGWGNPAAPLYSPNGDGQYSGFMYLDGEFKFRSGQDNWNAPDWGYGGADGTLAEQADNLNTATGFYKVDVNLAAMTYALTPITVGIIGPAQPGGWDTDSDMSFNAATGAWEATIALSADELKFRANDSWDINWGGDINNLTQGGDNIRLEEAGTYLVQLFLSVDGAHYCTFTKQ